MGQELLSVASLVDCQREFERKDSGRKRRAGWAEEEGLALG